MKTLVPFPLVVLLMIATSLSARAQLVLFSDDFEADTALGAAEVETVNRDPDGWDVLESSAPFVQVYRADSGAGLNSPAGQAGTSGNYLRLRRDFGDAIQPTVTRDVDPEVTRNSRVRFDFRCWVVSSSATDRGLRIFAKAYTGNSGGDVFDIRLRVDGSIQAVENGATVGIAGANGFPRNEWVEGSVEIDLAGTGYTLTVDGTPHVRPNRATSFQTDRIGTVGAGEYVLATAGSGYAFVDDLSLTKTVLTVTNINDSGAGSLRQLLADAADWATIVFDPSLDGQTIGLAGFPLTINKAITIDATDLPSGITIDAGGSSQVMRVASSGDDIRLRRLHLTGGQAPDGLGNLTTDGGGIWHAFGNLTLEECSVYGNRASSSATAADPAGGDGGGIYSTGSGLELIDCAVFDNHAGDASETTYIETGGRGGGIYREKIEAGFGISTYRACRIFNNHSGSGGLSLVGSGGGDGGGLYIRNTSVTLLECSIDGNTTGDGGDVHPLVIPESADDPSAEASGGNGGDGGGVYFRCDSGFSNRSLSVKACGITGNRTGRGGDGNGITNCRGGRGGNGAGMAVLSLDPNSGNFSLEADTFASNRTGRGGDGSRSISFGIDEAAAAGSGGDGGGIFILQTSSEPVALRFLTFSGNITGVAGVAGTMIEAGSGGSGGGFCNASPSSVRVQASGCILAANSSAGEGPDTQGGFAALFANLVSVQDEAATGEASIVVIGDLRLAPPGNYGSGTSCMPPLPGSPAIDYFPPSAGVAPDQRESPWRTSRDGDGEGTAGTDFGAVEFDPASDLAHFWPLDFDGDGSPFGVEHALGTDPLVSDRSDSRNLRIALPGASPQLSFGLNASALGVGAWSLQRSPDLSAGSWEQVYLFDGVSEFPEAGIQSVLGADSITITDQTLLSPAGFYRFVPLMEPQ